MKLDILCSDGSPLGVTSKTVYGDEWQIGVGGAELALLTMCETWHEMGHEVVLYNSPRERVSLFEQRMISQFSPVEKRDILIVFRSTNAKAVAAGGYKVWWSCDQFTTGMFKQFAPYMDKIVVISPFHQEYFKQNYGIENSIVTDLPVRVGEYEKLDYDEKYSKIDHRFLFSSVPDRGLEQLWRVWPLIKREIPDATVTITSDYRLWGAGGPMNERYRARWVAREGFSFLGAVNRERLVQEQMRASIMAYPCTYDELFCISVAEAQCAGVYTFTTNAGALPTTNMCTVLNWNATDARGDAHFVETVLSTVEKPDFKDRMGKIKETARIRFHPETIAKYWEDEVFDGK